MANIQRYGSAFDDLFNDLTKGYWVKPMSFPAETDLKMKVEVKESDKAFTVHAEIPGVKKEDIQVDVNGNQLSIRAEVKKESEKKEGEKVLHSERYYGMVSRSMTLPADVDTQGAKAEYKDGVLELSIPKKSTPAGKRITIG